MEEQGPESQQSRTSPQGACLARNKGLLELLRLAPQDPPRLHLFPGRLAAACPICTMMGAGGCDRIVAGWSLPVGTVLEAWLLADIASNSEVANDVGTVCFFELRKAFLGSALDIFMPG